MIPICIAFNKVTTSHCVEKNINLIFCLISGINNCTKNHKLLAKHDHLYTSRKTPVTGARSIQSHKYTHKESVLSRTSSITQRLSSSYSKRSKNRQLHTLAVEEDFLPARPVGGGGALFYFHRSSRRYRTHSSSLRERGTNTRKK